METGGSGKGGEIMKYEMVRSKIDLMIEEGSIVYISMQGFKLEKIF